MTVRVQQPWRMGVSGCYRPLALTDLRCYVLEPVVCGIVVPGLWPSASSLALSPPLSVLPAFSVSFSVHPFVSCLSLAIPTSLSLSPHSALSFRRLLRADHLAAAGAWGLWALLRWEEEVGHPHRRKVGMRWGSLLHVEPMGWRFVSQRPHPLPQPGFVLQV